MIKEKLNIRVTNSQEITTGSLWFPFSEIEITDKQYDNNLPFRNYSFENGSDNETDIILNPAPINSAMRWTVPASKTRETEANDNLKFYNVAIVNNGVDSIGIGELEIQLRNY